MQVTLKLIHDGITADMRKKLAAIRNAQPLMLAMGTAAASLAKRAFTDAAVRPAEWADLAK